MQLYYSFFIYINDFLGTSTPLCTRFSFLQKNQPTIPVTLPPLHEVNLYKSLQNLLVHIHLLWELVLLNESIVVIASSPSVCSETVQALTRLARFEQRYSTIIIKFNFFENIFLQFDLASQICVRLPSIFYNS